MFYFFAAEHAEIAESDHSKEKIQKASVLFFPIHILILLCVLRNLYG